MAEIRVSAKSPATAVAGSIAHVLREEKQADVQAIGVAAVYQAIKAIIIARDYLLCEGIDVVCLPKFVQLDIQGLERTGLRITVTIRSQGAPMSE